MKKTLIILVCAFLFAACGNKPESKEGEANQTDLDKIVIGDDEPGSQEEPGKNDTDPQIEEDGNDQQDNQNSNGGEDKNDEDPVSTCGNGIVDNGEVCDPTDPATASIDCFEIDDTYEPGIQAGCKDDCMGFDESGCEKKSLEPTGKCYDLKEGMNEDFDVNGRKRAFILNLPDDIESKEKWPVIFSWHGVNGNAAKMLGMVNLDVNNQTMPFILVTPENDDEFSLKTFKGIDWDVLNIKDGSAEAELFDALLECFKERWGVDENHIHTTGFSAGSINSNALGVLRGDVIASIFTNSGAYFSNKKNRDAMGKIGSNFLKWPDMTHSNKYVQVLVHGAQDEDKTGKASFNIDFYDMGTNDVEYLNEMGHDVIHCNHGLGHEVSDISYIIRFFKDHPKGTVNSPHSELEGYPDFCEFKPKTTK